MSKPKLYISRALSRKERERLEENWELLFVKAPKTLPKVATGYAPDTAIWLDETPKLEKNDPRDEPGKLHRDRRKYTPS